MATAIAVLFVAFMAVVVAQSRAAAALPLFQRKMQQRLRDKNRERAEAAERELAAEKRQNRRLRKALKDIQACPDGKSKSWPEIDAIIRAALNPTGDAMISGVWQ